MTTMSAIEFIGLVTAIASLISVMVGLYNAVHATRIRAAQEKVIKELSQVKTYSEQLRSYLISNGYDEEK